MKGQMMTLYAEVEQMCASLKHSDEVHSPDGVRYLLRRVQRRLEQLESLSVGDMQSLKIVPCPEEEYGITELTLVTRVGAEEMRDVLQYLLRLEEE
jgi:Fe-S oxidoreductase